MEHPHFYLGVFVPSSQGIFSKTGLYNKIHSVGGVPILGKFTLSETTLRREKLLNYVAEFVPRVIRYSSMAGNLYPPLNTESICSFQIIRRALQLQSLPENWDLHLKRILTGLDDILVAAYRNIRRKSIKVFSRKKLSVFRLASMSEQSPNPLSRITLSSDRDLFGNNRAQLDWRLSPSDLRSAIRSQEILAEEFQQAGLGRLFIELTEKTRPSEITGGWHQMGTTRMHRIRSKGVVDENCRVHGVSNLYVSGPSVFPTSGYANPALTIVALSVRLADHLKRFFP
jgi:hypothetical protein